MNPDVINLLNALNGTTSSTYQLGLGNLGLGAGQLASQNQQIANQLAEFNQQQALAAAQQAWQQGFSTTGQQEQYGLQQGAQQFGEQQQAAQNAITNQAGTLQNYLTSMFGPSAANNAAVSSAPGYSMLLQALGGGAGGKTSPASGGNLPTNTVAGSPYGTLNLNTPLGNQQFTQWQQSAV